MDSLFLSKLLPLLVYPLGLAILLVIVGTLFRQRRARWISSLLLLLAAFGLWIAATPFVASSLASRLENRFPARPIADVEAADVIILLGGVLSQSASLPVEINIGDPVDRVFVAARLFRAGKAPKIVVVGGNLPWESSTQAEAELLADLLVELGVPREAIVVETESRNTHENAVNAATIFAEAGWKRGLLVTSALHMPRALAAFRKAGLDVVPVPTDFRALPPFYESPLDLLPNADALALTTNVMKEMIGGWVYRSRGWT